MLLCQCSCWNVRLLCAVHCCCHWTATLRLSLYAALHVSAYAHSFTHSTVCCWTTAVLHCRNSIPFFTFYPRSANCEPHPSSCVTVCGSNEKREGERGNSNSSTHASQPPTLYANPLQHSLVSHTHAILCTPFRCTALTLALSSVYITTLPEARFITTLPCTIILPHYLLPLPFEFRAISQL